MDAVQKAKQDMNILLNVTDVLTQCLRHHQIYIHACTIFAYLRVCLTYMKQVAAHTMDYVNATTTNILPPDILPVKEFKGMLRHIELQSPSIMHLPISLDDTLHFHRYLKTHLLVAQEQFLLLIDVPIQDRAKQLQIYEIFNLPVPHSDVSSRYKINDKYIGITCDKTQAIVITKQQHSTCLHANGQFCNVDTQSRLLKILQHAQWPYMLSTTRKQKHSAHSLFFMHHLLPHPL